MKLNYRSLVTMLHCWMSIILLWVSMVTPTVCQSGDGGLGSGFDVYSVTMANHTIQAVGDEPERMSDNQSWITSGAFFPPPSPAEHYSPQPEKCSVHFSTNTASSRWLKAQKDELAYLQAIQRGNRAIMENLEQYVGAEVAGQSYEGVIKENIIGIQEEHKSCQEVVDKAIEDLERQLEGKRMDSLVGLQKIREESLEFEELLRRVTDIASRLEESSQTLHASFKKQLKDIVNIHQ
ncbi:uncharacterized protein si:ch211-142k18.1 [Thalassophryne amazonica]|uniref:uncharacterized protein si:ch211-142k18.1 n=1 Tax=Thalassophryne amazonica TaxID=390379 RepID=UPI0014710BDA|nr:uncharacterized protein si:ch211-142k18.1 [Thalassophryne amazonica]